MIVGRLDSFHVSITFKVHMGVVLASVTFGISHISETVLSMKPERTNKVRTISDAQNNNPLYHFFN